MIITVLLVLGFFLYGNIYQTITQSEQIIILKQEVAPDIVNMKKFNDVLQKITKKTSLKEIDWKKINNPFLVPAAEVEIAVPEEIIPNQETLENQNNPTE